MSYLVLARKYRPQSFEDLVGQEHVTKTLANAIAQRRIAHAFLFTGVRGVGKTTSARVLSKCLNCLAGDGPTATPCQQCAACTEIAAGVDMDVQEIDAASYNGVDEVRKLQEGLAFRPARDRFKIYIVDEVHMLSTAAWNAFLKTLEEPPPHVKFIFATTEVHKVPVTILSRCQRYDFKLVSARQIADRLGDVLRSEAISADADAISVLAREAAGSMRDAMSLVDQVIAYGGDKLTAEDVTKVLGVADRRVLFDLTSAVLGGDAANALDLLDAVSRQGFDLVHLCRDLLRYLRNLVVAKVCAEEQARSLLDLADAEVADVLALSQKSDPDDLTRLFQGLSKSFDEIVKSGQVRASLEMTLVRLARRPQLLPLDELLARLGDLERRLATGAPPPTRGGGGGGRATATAPASISQAAPVGVGVGVAGGATLFPTPSAADAPRATSAPSSAPLARATPPRLSREPQTSGALALAEERAEGGSGRVPEPIEVWRTILGRIRDTRPMVASLLELAAPIAMTRERIVLAFEHDSFEDSSAAETDARELVAEHARAHFGCAVTVAFEVATRGSKLASVAYLDAAKKKAALAEARAHVENHPLVQKSIAIFDAELRDVRLPAQDD